MTINFQIDHLDPLGQGVYKNEGAVTFIKKTLPGEQGTAEIIRERKGVSFAKLTSIEKKSPERITPECKHFDQCNGCDYLHTKYENEIEYKKKALARHLFKFNAPTINVHPSKDRLNYRNRLQLHYDKKSSLLGLQDQEFNIVRVPNCVIAKKEILDEMNNLYLNYNWITLMAKQPSTGHIELYLQADKTVKVSVNKTYADGGFTQVNEDMNQVLKTWLNKRLDSLLKPTDIIFDLFGGNGNLTETRENPTLVVDFYKTMPSGAIHQSFLSQDLYHREAIANIKKSARKGIANPDWILFDPPRSGVKNISEFLTEFNPKGFVYIGCDPSSFARDCAPLLEKYNMDTVELFDLFPGTQHFETVGIFTIRKNT